MFYKIGQTSYVCVWRSFEENKKTRKQKIQSCSIQSANYDNLKREKKERKFFFQKYRKLDPIKKKTAKNLFQSLAIIKKKRKICLE